MMYEAELDEVRKENCGELLIEQQPRVKPRVKSHPEPQKVFQAERAPYSIWDDCDRPGWM